MSPAAMTAGPLSEAQREALAAALRTHTARLRGEISAALRQSGEEEAIRLANHLEDTDDEAVADLETAIEIAALERDVKELREMEAATARLKRSDFGLCADCGEAIAFERLLATPAATRCVPCQARRERERGDDRTTPTL